jgi:transposase
MAAPVASDRWVAEGPSDDGLQRDGSGRGGGWRLTDQFADLTADRAEQLLGRVYPTGAEASTRHQLATDLIGDVRDLDRRIATVQARITAAVTQSKTGLVGLFGVGPVLAAKLLGEVGDVGLVPDQASLRSPHRGPRRWRPPAVR